MRKLLQVLGIILVLQGVSGTIDHLAVQPFFGIFLNVFNRVILPRVDALAGYELFANIALAVMGVAVIIAAERG